jgi:hypothetical protein
MAKVGLLCEWPRAKYVQAGRSPMLPLIYSTKIKRPKTNYFLRAIIGQDYTLLLLAFSLVSSDPVICSISLLFFLISYFCTYEIGYYENDRLAHKYENKPRVSEEFSSYLGCFKPWFAWLWGIIFSVPAAWLASSEISWIPSALETTGWGAFIAVWLSFLFLLLSVRGVFYWFNRTPERGRILPMLILQLARTSGFMLLLPTSVVGAIFCLSWALGRWIPYMIYRFSGSEKGFPSQLVICMLFMTMFMTVGFTSAEGFSSLLNVQGALIIFYSLLRGSKSLWTFRKELKLQTGTA